MSGAGWPAAFTQRRLWPHETRAMDAMSVRVTDALFFTELDEY